jgi:hypothetical protein
MDDTGKDKLTMKSHGGMRPEVRFAEFIDLYRLQNSSKASSYRLFQVR